jgi:hypothetical protein
MDEHELEHVTERGKFMPHVGTVLSGAGLVDRVIWGSDDTATQLNSASMRIGHCREYNSLRSQASAEWQRVKLLRFAMLPSISRLGMRTEHVHLAHSPNLEAQT